MESTVYDESFWANHLECLVQSACVVVPVVTELVAPQSVVDVGCGVGAWLGAFAESGVKVLKGLDGDYIDRRRLCFDASSFTPVDLRTSIEIPGKYDLAVCLEVAEHLPARQAGGLVTALTQAAPVVLFSAALPGQEGANHVNEQWPEYWRQLFEAHGYRMLDPIRPRIREDKRVAWWYRQNIVLFVSSLWLDSHPMLQPDTNVTDDFDDDWIHAKLYRKANSDLGVKDLLNLLRSAIKRSLVRKLKRVQASQES
jgi:Methyltransferase domain